MFKKRIIVGPDTRIVRLAGRPPRATLTLLIVQLGLFLAYAFADGPAWVAEHLALSVAGCLGRFELWQIVTAPWIHIGTRGLLLNMLSLWVFGSALERWWGGRRFVVFYAVTATAGVLGGMVAGFVAQEQVISGSAGAAVALVVAVGYIFANHLVHMFTLLGIKTKWLCLALGGVMVLSNLLSLDFFSAAMQAGGALTALAFLFSARDAINDMRVKRAKRKLGVIEGGKKRDEKKWVN